MTFLSFGRISRPFRRQPRSAPSTATTPRPYLGRGRRGPPSTQSSTGVDCVCAYGVRLVRRANRSAVFGIRPPRRSRRAVREGRRRGDARDPRRPARGRRRPAGGPRVHRQGHRARHRRGGDPLGPARRPGGQDHLRRPGGDAGRGRRARGPEPLAQSADRDPDGRPAGLGQDHHRRQAGAAPGARAQEGAAGLAGHPPSRRHGAAGHAGRAGRRHTGLVVRRLQLHQRAGPPVGGRAAGDPADVVRPEPDRPADGRRRAVQPQL